MKASFTEMRCKPCEGGVDPISPAEAAEHLPSMPSWTLSESGTEITRKINLRHFAQAIEKVNEIADLAESEQHHPDLHVTGYRHLTIVLTTHAIGGLSENDFILAAKIDEILK